MRPIRIRFWTIAINPHPTLLLRFGVGIIVEDVTRHVFTFRLASLGQLPQSMLAGDTREITRNSLSMLQQHLGTLTPEQTPLDLDQSIDLPSYLHSATGHLNGFLDLQPGGVMAWPGELAGAADHLFEMFVHAERDTQQRPVTRIRKRVQSTYSTFENIQRHLITQPHVEIRERDMPLDLAIFAHNEAIEINRAFSFRGKPDAAKLNQFDAWTYRIQSLRDKGGYIKLNSSAQSLRPDVPVVAFVDSPTTDKQRELQQKATIEWSELGIETVPLEGITQHAQIINDRIPA